MTDYDEVPLRSFHVRIGVASTGGVFADGFGLGIIGIALTLATPALELSPRWQGLLGGASLAGLFLGALLTGPVADRFGRRRIFASNMVLAALLSVLQLGVTSGTQLLLLRLMIGFLLGTDYVVSKTLLTEFVPRRLRGRVLSMLSIAWAGGYACAYAVGFFMRHLGPEAWRWMLVTGAVPSLLIVPLRIGVPESPLWLIEHGRGEHAAEIVRKRLGPDVQLPLHIPRPAQARGRWAQLFTRRWRTRTLVGCVFFVCQVIPYFAIGTFVTQVMAALQLRGSYVGGLIYNLALLGGAVCGVVIVDRISRRSFLIGSFLAAAITMSLLGIGAGQVPGITIVLFAIFAAVLSAASNLVYVYLPELFPTDLRASGIGLAVAASRVGSAVSTLLLPVVVEVYGVRAALAACVAVLTIGGAVCYCWAPETRNLSLVALDQGVLGS